MLWDQISITRKNSVRNTNAWRLNNTFLNNQLVTEEIKKKIKKFIETDDNENTTQNLCDAAKAVLRRSKREVYSTAILPQETRKTFNRQYNFIPKTTGKRRRTTKQPKIKELSINKWKKKKNTNIVY